IHGDINPDNILINTNEMNIKITDFGFSFNLNKTNKNVFIDEIEKDRIKYIAPEQTGRMNQKVDVGTDLYSLGMLFYEMLISSTPFNSEDVMELIHQHIAKKPLSPNEINSNINITISNIIMKLLEKNINERYKSTYGLIYDLKYCLNSIIENTSLNNFVLGTYDLSPDFTISEKIYGKEKQLQSLLNIISNYKNKNTNVIFITGKEGTGKSYFINYINNNFIRNVKNLIDIKFDKTKLDNPYYSIIKALSLFIGNLLIHNSEELNIIKKSIRENFSNDFFILSKKIPEINFLLDKNNNTSNQLEDNDFYFINALKKFLLLFISDKKRLIISFDNIEYADTASINFINNLLTNTEFRFLTLILVSRDENDEIKDNSLKYQISEIINRNNVETSHIKLINFNINEIYDLLYDTFGKKINNINYIASVIYLKTQGNPLFVNEFIKSLYDKKLISFKEGVGWFCETQSIDKMEITKNVVDLILEKIKYLSNYILDILKIASCIGLSFDINLVKKIYNSEFDINSIISSGFIIPEHSKNNINKEISIFVFLHEKIQEAIYSLINSEERNNIHYKIGEIYLLNNYEDIFETVNHFNKALDLVIKNKSNINIAILNLNASIKAKKSSLYDLALNYIRYAESLVDESLFINYYELAYNIYFEYAHLEYLNFNFDISENILNFLINKNLKDFDKAKAYEIKTLLYITTNRITEALEIGLLGLKTLNFILPITNFSINKELIIDFFKVRILLNNLDEKHIVNLPEMSDKRLLIINNILIALVTVTYMSNTKLMFLIVHKMLLLSIKNGNSDVSAYAYAAYGSFVAFILNNPSKGFTLGQISLKLIEKYNNQAIKNKVNFIYANLIHHWVKHDRKDIEILNKNISISIESGDLVYAGYSILHSIIKMYVYGDKLDDIYEFAKNNLLLISQSNNNISEEFLIRNQMILCLKGLTYNYNTLSDGNFNEEKFFYSLKKSGNKSRLIHAYIVKMQLNYLFSNYEIALEYAEEAKKYLNSCYATVMISEFYFFYSLILTSLCIKKPNKYKKYNYLSVIIKNQRKFKKWSDNCPESFYHRYILIEAELCFIENKYSRASEYYNLSIELSKKYNFIHYEALANELSAKFYLSREHEIIAKEYINEAYNCYNKWGASIKLLELKTNYPYLFTKKNNLVPQIVDITEKRKDFKLDLETIMKASQTLSEEIFLDKLIDKLIRIVVENAGAERGILILNRKDEFFIEAEGNINYDRTMFFHNKKLESSDSVSHYVVNYVERTGNYVVIEDALSDGVFTSDYYILSKKPKSILCLPINKQQNLIGILYLENNLTKGAFTSDRIQVLRLISSQAAISLENARLYDQMRELNIYLEQNKNNLEDMVDKRTKQLKITQKRLIDAAHRSGMAEIATGVLHNIGNILNGVNISSQLISESIEKSKIKGLIKANELLKENINNIEHFLLNDPKGKKLLQYYLSIGEILNSEINEINKEAKSLSQKISLMKDVIVTQQSYAKTEFLNEKLDPITVLEDAISLQNTSLIKNNIKIIKKYNKTSEINVHKSKLINIIINLLKNSEEALEKKENNKIIFIEINQYKDKYVEIKVSDNGEGILRENINKVFNHGFTTKPKGHGFGLHTCANSMTEMGAKIIVKSDGLNKGATFILQFNI
ncbi:MAG: ATP-binding protein, partial [Candidatus Sericytochromatia bacterium]